MFLLRRASLCSVIISDRSALEISSRGSSKLTSEFSASEIFVQRLPGLSVTSLRRRLSREDSAFPAPSAPTKMMLLRGRRLQPRACAPRLSVTLLISPCHSEEQHCCLALALTAKSQPHNGKRVTRTGLSRTTSPWGTLPPWRVGGLRHPCWLPSPTQD